MLILRWICKMLIRNEVPYYTVKKFYLLHTQFSELMLWITHPVLIRSTATDIYWIYWNCGLIHFSDYLQKWSKSGSTYLLTNHKLNRNTGNLECLSNNLAFKFADDIKHWIFFECVAFYTNFCHLPKPTRKF